MATEATSRDDTFIFIGDVVPYKSEASRIARARVEKFEEDSKGSDWWRGTDVDTGVQVFCSLDDTFDLIDQGHKKK